MENITFCCPECQGSLSVPASLAGVSGPCPFCNGTITAPSPSPEPASFAPPTPEVVRTPQVPAVPQTHPPVAEVPTVNSPLATTAEIESHTPAKVAATATTADIEVTHDSRPVQQLDSYQEIPQNKAPSAIPPIVPPATEIPMHGEGLASEPAASPVHHSNGLPPIGQTATATATATPPMAAPPSQRQAYPPQPDSGAYSPFPEAPAPNGHGNGNGMPGAGSPQQFQNFQTTPAPQGNGGYIAEPIESELRKTKKKAGIGGLLLALLSLLLLIAISGFALWWVLNKRGALPTGSPPAGMEQQAPYPDGSPPPNEGTPPLNQGNQGQPPANGAPPTPTNGATENYQNLPIENGQHAPTELSPPAEPISSVHSDSGSSLSSEEKNEEALQLKGKMVDTKVPEITDINGNPPPENAMEAAEALTAFLSADNLEERIKFVKNADDIRHEMETYYSGNADGLIGARAITFNTIQPGSSDDPGDFAIFIIETSAMPEGFPAYVQDVGGSWSVAWKPFVEFQGDLLAKFMTSPTEGRQTFHVMVRRSHYLEEDVPGLDSKIPFKIEPPMPSRIFYAFVDSDSDLGREMANRIGWGFQAYPVVELEWKHGTDGRSYVDIVSVPRYGWGSA